MKFNVLALVLASFNIYSAYTSPLSAQKDVTQQSNTDLSSEGTTFNKDSKVYYTYIFIFLIINRCFFFKVAIVTGGANGIGKELTNRLIKKGIRVLISDINEKDGLDFENQLNSVHGENASSFLKTDVMDSAQLKAVFDKARDKFGRIDVRNFYSQSFFII